jgi:hypothetical protein
VPGAEGEELGGAAQQIGGREEIDDAGPFAHGLQQGIRDALVCSGAPCGVARAGAHRWVLRCPWRDGAGSAWVG